MSQEFAHAYPPAEWTADGIATTLETVGEAYPVPRYEDAPFWETAAADPVIADLTAAVRQEAASIADAPVVQLPASDYLGYSRTGRRDAYSTKARGRNLGVLIVAECLERAGTYLDPALDYIWAMCEQSTWTRPAHLRGEQYLKGLPGPVPPSERTIALQTAINAKLLAEASYVLGDQLHPAAGERIVAEIDKRVLTPFLARDDYSWQHPPTANHNAVCNASILIAALHVESDPARQAEIVAKAARNMRHYLDDFDADGCTGEGVGYWKFGFSFYTKAAIHLEKRTDGEYSLFAPPVTRAIARFPLQVELSPNRFPPFSDANESEDITPYLYCKLGERFDQPVLAARGRADLADRDNTGHFSSLLRNIAWRGESASTIDARPPTRSFFDGRQWWISRVDPGTPDGLVLAAKGGHNGEQHNHNDCGSFVCHVGRESVLTDPGRDAYVDGYFGSDRYEFLATRSLGHSVPYLNETEQAPGDGYRAKVVDRRETPAADTFSLDLTDCYPDAAGLDRLQREFLLDRTAGSAGEVTVTDRLAFRDSPTPDRLESILVSFRPIETDGDELQVAGDQGTTTVRATGSHPIDLETERLEEAVKEQDLWRARCCCQIPDQSGEVAVTIRPELH